VKWNSNGTRELQIAITEIRMRRVILALLAAGGLAGLGALPAKAVGTRYPFCITGPEQPGLSNCTFTSYEQCQATASGRRLWCLENPFYVRESDGGAPPSTYRSLPGRVLPPAPGTPKY
jgi:uncharacterized protein DUF3551